MKKTTIALQLVVWNGAKYLPYLFASLQKQTNHDWDIYILDNNSKDNSKELSKAFLDNSEVTGTLISQKRNKGFAGGHNILFEHTQDYKYTMLVNQDLVFDPDVIEQMQTYLDAHDDVGSISPRLMRWQEGEGFQKSQNVDSLGIRRSAFWSFVEIGAGKTWQKHPHKEGVLEVTCVSGTAPMYRRKVIDQVAYANNEVFDGLYNSYKEDIDLGLRMTKAGYKHIVLLDVVAYHDRTAERSESLIKQAKTKAQQPRYVQYHSYKNHLMLLLKHVDIKQKPLSIIPIMWYELTKASYYLLTAPPIIKRGMHFVVAHMPEILKKRKHIQKIR